MKKTAKRLCLNKESIRALAAMDQVLGGEPIGSIEVCPPNSAPACASQYASCICVSEHGGGRCLDD